MASSQNTRIEYVPRNEGEVLAIDPETGQAIAVTREPPQNEVFMPAIVVMIGVIAILLVAVLGIPLFWEYIVGFSQMPGRG